MARSNYFSGTYLNTQEFLENNELDKSYYLFSGNALEQSAREFQRNFPGEVSYAVKANPHPFVLETLWRAGIQSFDVASIGEIEHVRQNLPFSNLNFNNPVRSQRSFEVAYEQFGVRSFVVDDLIGLESLASYCDSDMEVTVRFKLQHENAAYDFGSKFGADPTQAVVLIRRAAQLGATVSMTFHPGSQCIDPLMYGKYIAASARIANLAEIPVARLNVGGGFPVNYAGNHIADLTAYFLVISEGVERHFGGNAPTLLCEPGRAMVAESTSLVAEVIHVRENGCVFINEGVYGGLQEQTLLQSELPVRVWRNASPVEGERIPRQLFGPTCDPVDRLSVPCSLPVDMQPGDCVEFGAIGAYGSATATQFNGFEPGGYVRVIQGFRST